MKVPETSLREEVSLAIRGHVADFWKGAKIQKEFLGKGPILRVLPHFSVLRIALEAGKPVWAYFTLGCFSVDSGKNVMHEFFLLSPKQDFDHVETLTMLAYLHADPEHRLDVGHTVNIGRPWMRGSSCDHLLVSLPYPYGPKLEWLQFGTTMVRFLWALPITAREAAFVSLYGYQKLEEKFETARLSYMDPNRESAV